MATLTAPYAVVGGRRGGEAGVRQREALAQLGDTLRPGVVQFAYIAMYA
jgi:hypothetical protein